MRQSQREIGLPEDQKSAKWTKGQTPKSLLTNCCCCGANLRFIKLSPQLEIQLTFGSLFWPLTVVEWHTNPNPVASQIQIHYLLAKSQDVIISFVAKKTCLFCALICERAINVLDCAKNALISFLTALALALSAEKIIAQTKNSRVFL